MLTKKLIISEVLKAYDLLLMDYDDFLEYYHENYKCYTDTDMYSIYVTQKNCCKGILRHIVLYSGVDNSEVDYRSHFEKEYNKGVIL